MINYHLTCQNDKAAQQTYNELPQSIRDIAVVCMTFHPSIPAIIVVTTDRVFDAKPLLDLGFKRFEGEEGSNDDEEEIPEA